jgi:hypothetical protein
MPTKAPSSSNGPAAEREHSWRGLSTARELAEPGPRSGTYGSLPGISGIGWSGMWGCRGGRTFCDARLCTPEFHASDFVTRRFFGAEKAPKGTPLSLSRSSSLGA